MKDTEPMAVVESPAATTHARAKAPAALAFAGGAALALFVACVWMQMQMVELRQDVREARQAAAIAQSAADRIVRESRVSSTDAALPDEITGAEDDFRAPLPTETMRPAGRVALHVRVVAAVRARLQALGTMVRELRSLW